MIDQLLKSGALAHTRQAKPYQAASQGGALHLLQSHQRVEHAADPPEDLRSLGVRAVPDRLVEQSEN